MSSLRAPWIAGFALLAAALADIYRHPQERIRGSKWLWSAVATATFMGIGPSSTSSSDERAEAVQGDGSPTRRSEDRTPREAPMSCWPVSQRR